MKKFLENFFGLVCLLLAAAQGTTIGAADSKQKPAPPPTASVSGVVIDSVSRLPVSHVTVALQSRVIKIENASFEWASISVQTKMASTDELGAFSFSEISPVGVYQLSAVADRYHKSYLGSPDSTRPWYLEFKPGEKRSSETIQLVRHTRVSGRVVDGSGKPVAGVQVMALSPTHRSGIDTTVPAGNTTTNAAGGYELNIASRVARFVASPLPAMIGYRSTFYPSVPGYQEATPVDLAPGADLHGIDIVMLRGPTGAVTVEAPGIPARTVIRLQPDWCPITACVPIARDAVVGKESTATIRNVPPGRYALFYFLPENRPGERASEITGFRQPSGPPVTTDGSDVAFAVDWRGSVVTGKMVSPAGTLPAIRWVCLNSISLFDQYCADVSPDGSFQIAGLRDDEYNASAWAGGKLVRAVTLRGQDVTDRAFRIATSANLEVTLADKPGDVHGLVSGNRDALVQASVFVFPVDQSLWMGFTDERFDRPRRLQQISVVEGKYAVTSLPAGDYWVAATTDDFSANGWQFPDQLRSLMSGASRVFLSDGGSVRLDIKLTGGR